MVVKQTHVRAEQTPSVMAAHARSSLASPRSESVLLRLLSALLPVALLRVLVIPAPLVLPLSRRTPCLRGLPDGYFNRSDQFHAHVPYIVVFLCVFATCEWHCVNVGMSMRWRGRLAPTATLSEVPFLFRWRWCRFEVVVAICELRFWVSRCLGWAVCPVF